MVTWNKNIYEINIIILITVNRLKMNKLKAMLVNYNWL